MQFFFPCKTTVFVYIFCQCFFFSLFYTCVLSSLLSTVVSSTRKSQISHDICGDVSLLFREWLCPFTETPNQFPPPTASFRCVGEAEGEFVQKKKKKKVNSGPLPKKLPYIVLSQIPPPIDSKCIPFVWKKKKKAPFFFFDILFPYPQHSFTLSFAHLLSLPSE